MNGGGGWQLRVRNEIGPLRDSPRLREAKTRKEEERRLGGARARGIA